MPKRMTAFLRTRRFPGHALTWLAALVLLLVCQNALAGSLVWNPIGYGGGGRLTTAVVAPNTPSDILIGSDVAGFFTNTDAGQTFMIYAVVDDNELMVSTDGGATFNQGPGGLPGVGINVLTAYPQGQKLSLAGFNGIGLYALQSREGQDTP